MHGKGANSKDLLSSLRKRPLSVGVKRSPMPDGDESRWTVLRQEDCVTSEKIINLVSLGLSGLRVEKKGHNYGRT